MKKVLLNLSLVLVLCLSVFGFAACGNGYANVDAAKAFTYNSENVEAINGGATLTFKDSDEGPAWYVKEALNSIKFDVATTLENGEFVAFVISYNKVAATGTDKGTPITKEEYGDQAGQETRIGIAKVDGKLYVGPCSQGIAWGNSAETVSYIVGAGNEISSFKEIKFDFNFDKLTTSVSAGGKTFTGVIHSAAVEIRTLWVGSNATSVDFTNLMTK